MAMPASIIRSDDGIPNTDSRGLQDRHFWRCGPGRIVIPGDASGAVASCDDGAIPSCDEAVLPSAVGMVTNVLERSIRRSRGFLRC